MVQAHATRLLGSIILTPRMSRVWMSLMFALLGVLLAFFAATGTYTRRSTVAGQLVPETGVLRIHTPQTGVVLEKRVIEGQKVAKGDVLYVLTSDRPGSGARGVQADIGIQVDERKQSLQAEIARNRSVESAETQHLLRRGDTLRAEAASIDRQIDQQKLRLALAEDARKRYQGLADKDFVAKEQLFQKETDLSEQVSRLQALQREALVAQRELAAALREVEATRARYGNQNALIARAISSAQQELTEVDARGRVVITAPQAGQATLVSAEVGQVQDASRPLLSIVPTDAKLEARLYAPSRTIGFVRPGDQVLIRYQSCPFQKFGQQEAVVTSIATTAVPSSELTGFALPDTLAGDTVYAITVRLKSQAVMAYGAPRPLQAGMRLDADILQETRRLYEWALEPLFSITGSFK